MKSVRINKNYPRYLVPLFWLVVALLHYFCDLIALKFIGRESDLLFTSIFYLGWFYWIPLGSLVRILANRFPIVEGETMMRDIGLHAFFALIVAMLHQTLDFFTISGIRAILYPSSSPFPLYHISYTSFIHFIVYFFVLSINLGSRYFEKLQLSRIEAAELESKLSLAQLEALKMQIQPHFLFNTHNSIIGLMLNGSFEKAIKMLTRLSDLLRYTLDKSGAQQIHLKEEISFIKMYLDIQSIRFSDRVRIEYDVENEVNESLVPNFILQPLVENALKHGIEPYSDAGLIKVVGMKQKDKLLLLIIDDGMGIQSNGYTEGIGLRNVKARLEQTYGNDFHFQIGNNLKGKGAICSILIPLKF